LDGAVPSVWVEVSATLSHMDVSVRDLRNRTGEVVAAVQAGQRVTLLNRGTPVADIVPHVGRTRWLPGAWMSSQLTERQADPGLTYELERDLGQTIDEL
jgi:prevent-host-death family protein